MDNTAKDDLQKFWETEEGKRMTDEIREDAVAAITRPMTYWCEFGNVIVSREETSLLLEWKIYQGLFADPRRCQVHATMRYVDLYPNTETLRGEPLAINKPGNGSCRIELDEGDCVQFQFMFRDIRKGLSSDDVIKGLTFFAAIPLSEESQKILNNAAATPPEQVKYEMEAFLEKQDVFEAACSTARERIKAKGYPPEEEARRIEEFDEFARQAKERYGM